MITDTVQWSDVVTQMSSFLSLNIVLVGLAVILGVPVVGLIVQSIRGAFRRGR